MDQNVIVMKTDNFPSAIKQILVARRKRRIIHALSKVTTKPSMKIIDIGCGIDGRSFENFIPPNFQVIGIDLKDPQKINHTYPDFQYIQQDAQDLSQFADKQFDLAVSIGLLEHVIEKEAFKKTALEIRRVAKQYIVMVPAKYCSIEPHYGLPFFPLFPYSIQVLLVKAFNLSNARENVKRDPQFIKKGIIWRSNKEYQKAFPESKIYITSTLEQIVIIKKDEI
jgi:hypothetical protein